MKLYYSPGACSLAAHIVADEADLRLQLEKVDLKSHKTENGQDYYTVNPKGYVPTIQLDDGSTLTENVAVLNYLADHTGHKLYTPEPGSMEHYRLEEWLGFITTEVHKSFAPFFQNGSEREKRRAREKILKRFGYVNDALKNGRFLMGDRLTVADAYLFVMLTWAKKVEFNLSRFSNLNAFFQRMSERPSVQRALKEEGLPLAA
ncbi:MAG TPA: glutathione transferase GstA [Rhizomicrobium sp.]|jgi:glutathione S-transferase|nr:glutathione transferase GstA [Rhizomicrobium sp.]